MKINNILKIIKPYCSNIRYNGKHFIAYPKQGSGVITISKTASDTNHFKQVYRDFRRAGIEISELKKG